MSALPVEYDDVLAQVRRLGAEEQRRLLGELIALVEDEDVAPMRRSLRELRGVGKEVWAGIDAQDYVDRERAAWSK